MKKSGLVIIVFLLTISVVVQAANPTCAEALDRKDIITDAPNGGYKQIIELAKTPSTPTRTNSEDSSVLRRLAYALLNSNARPLLEIRSELIRMTNDTVKQLTGHTMFAPINLSDIKAGIESGEAQIEIREVRQLSSSNLNIYEARFVSNGRTWISFQFRSNGKVAFLNNSYEYRTVELADYNGAYVDHGIVNTFSVGKLILETLSSDVQLSRSMSETERKMWLSGEISRLGSPTYNGKVHFAFKYCYFKCAPYIVHLPKVLLVELFDKHLLEINTFESRENLRDGMPDWAATDAGINVEFAFSKEALAQIQPFIAAQLNASPVDLGRD